MHEWFLLSLGGDLKKNINLGLYSASFDHSVLYVKDMTDMEMITYWTYFDEKWFKLSNY